MCGAFTKGVFDYVVGRAVSCWFVCGCITPPSPLVIFSGSRGVGVVLYVGSRVQSFYWQVVEVGSLANDALVLGTCPPLAADVVKRS